MYIPQVLRIIARINMRGNSQLADAAFRAYTAASVSAGGHSTSDSRFHENFDASGIPFAETHRPSDVTADVARSIASTVDDDTRAPPPVEPLLRHASSRPHHSGVSDDDAGLSGADTVIALMQVSISEREKGRVRFLQHVTVKCVGIKNPSYFQTAFRRYISSLPCIGRYVCVN